MATLNIPKRTLPIGETIFGPIAVPNVSHAAFSIDRTVAGGLNSLDDTSLLTFAVQTSPDGGQTWNDAGGCASPGGVIVIKGVPIAATTFDASPLVPGDQLRVVVQVDGPSPVVVTGSITAT